MVGFVLGLIKVSSIVIVPLVTIDDPFNIREEADERDQRSSAPTLHNACMQFVSDDCKVRLRSERGGHDTGATVVTKSSTALGLSNQRQQENHNGKYISTPYV